MDRSKQAFPVALEYSTGGMTLREYAAVAAMQGLLANPSVQSWDEKAETPHELAEACAVQSVMMADALIEELNR
jgi:hypothetical protein